MNNFIYIETYGCTANQNNSEILAGLLTRAGYSITNNEKIADIIILNTCVVKKKTENKIKRRIQDLSLEKDKLIIVAGCMPQTDSKQIKKLNENVILLGTHHFKDILNLIRDYKENKLNIIKQKEYLSNKNEEKLVLPKIPLNKLISITQISEGCFGSCSYCKTCLAKNKLYSYSIENIVKSIESDLENGAKEVWITSQDNASYGMDKGRQMLPELLNKILSLNHNFKLRIGMINPNNLYTILEEIIEIYKNKKVYKFLHIPIQSASDSILLDMNRHYKIKIVEEIITQFKKEFSDLVLSTDIIVGYPTETDSDFKKNLDFIKKFKPDVFNLSKFSMHKNTPIYEQFKQNKITIVPIETIKERTKKLMNLHRETALENKKKYLKKELDVFVNKKRLGFYEARTDNYNLIFISSNDKSILGKNIKVKIEKINVHSLVGEVV
jgi:threonylcarbamoyladenosine tRNA methylthiotransferase CDKAL1